MLCTHLFQITLDRAGDCVSACWQVRTVGLDIWLVLGWPSIGVDVAALD
jgi:hypothetical protein